MLEEDNSASVASLVEESEEKNESFCPFLEDIIDKRESEFTN